MKKIRVIVFVGAIAVGVIVGLRTMSGALLFSHSLSHDLQLKIHQDHSFGDATELRITYHKPPTIGTFIEATQVVQNQGRRIYFEVIVDTDLGLTCVFDLQSLGFLLIYNSHDGDLWDSTGRSGGWHGSDRAEWEELLGKLRAKWHRIPYVKLP